MSRKDYILIAAAIKRNRDSYSLRGNGNAIPALHRACTDCAIALASDLAAANPAFDRARFLAACGVTI